MEDIEEGESEPPQSPVVNMPPLDKKAIAAPADMKKLKSLPSPKESRPPTTGVLKDLKDKDKPKSRPVTAVNDLEDVEEYKVFCLNVVSY